MNLHALSVPIFIVSLVLAVLALIGHVVLIPFVTLYGFWVAIIAYMILAFGIVMALSLSVAEPHLMRKRRAGCKAWMAR